MLGNFLQQTTAADGIFRCISLGALRDKVEKETSKERILNSFYTDLNAMLSVKSRYNRDTCFDKIRK